MDSQVLSTRLQRPRDGALLDFVERQIEAGWRPSDLLRRALEVLAEQNGAVVEREPNLNPAMADAFARIVAMLLESGMTRGEIAQTTALDEDFVSNIAARFDKGLGN
jgi:hypothetical protein